MNYKQFQHFWQQSLISIYSSTEASTLFHFACNDFLHLSSIKLRSILEEEIKPIDLSLLSSVLVELLSHKPYQYVSGKAWFMNFCLTVNPAVLIPRPETEELVQWVYHDFKDFPEFRFVDLCTGSGCIAIALKRLFPSSTALAIDIDDSALNLASQNAIDLNCSIQFTKMDVLKESFLPHQQFDAIISNPPYVLESDKESMSKSVVDFEPSIALFVPDNDELVFYKRILELASKHLKPKGFLYFEMHEKKANDLINFIAHQDKFVATLGNDLSGKQRMLKVGFK